MLIFFKGYDGRRRKCQGQRPWLNERLGSDIMESNGLVKQAIVTVIVQTWIISLEMV